MGFLDVRVRALSAYLAERWRHGTAEQAGTIADEVLFVLDGVGGFQFAPLLIRRTLREIQSPLPTVYFDWQFGLTGEIWTDLMWLRRNRVMGAKLARKLLAFRRRHPETKIHLFACSGGAGIGVFACEHLRGRPIIETLILACPALSPAYNLAPALRAVQRGYALVSHQDSWILGLGTRLFGTTDRRFTSAAGRVGFQIPEVASPADHAAYERLREIRWFPEMRAEGHRGGHTMWASPAFIRKHLLPLLAGRPLLPHFPVTPSRRL